MTSRPILFSAPMVRALLAATKYQTRRIIKPQPAPFIQQTPDRHPTTRTAPYIDAYCGERKTEANPRGMSREWHWWTADNRLGEHAARCPYGQPGDRLWVRETWAHVGDEFEGHCEYAATCEVSGIKWKPSIHMFRNDSRLTLEITDVRAERLQEISEEDAKAEGAEAIGWGGFGPITFLNGYRMIWNQINGPGSWDANPFVWAVSFKRADA